MTPLLWFLIAIVLFLLSVAMILDYRYPVATLKKHPLEVWLQRLCTLALIALLVYAAGKRLALW